MQRKLDWFLILGGLLWILFWTAHTIAHGPLNPAPETGRFLGMSSMFYAVWMMFLSSVPLMFGWIRLYKFTIGHWKIVRLVGVLCGTVGLLAIFIAGALGLFSYIQQGIAQANLGLVWYIGTLGQVVSLFGTLVFGIGFIKVKEIGNVVRFAPIVVAILVPIITYLRRPDSPLLDMGSFVGYALLESLGVLFGVCWIILGLGAFRHSVNLKQEQPSSLR